MEWQPLSLIILYRIPRNDRIPVPPSRFKVSDTSRSEMDQFSGCSANKLIFEGDFQKVSVLPSDIKEILVR